MAKTRIGPTLLGQIDFDARYEIDDKGYHGIAWHLIGYAKEWTNESYTFDCIDPAAHPDDDDHSSACYIYNEPEAIENRDRVIAVMVGDDREFEFDISYLLRIDDDDYCPGCGQIGCKAYYSGE